jgi:hypothetical protein
MVIDPGAEIIWDYHLHGPGNTITVLMAMFEDGTAEGSPVAVQTMRKTIERWLQQAEQAAQMLGEALATPTEQKLLEIKTRTSDTEVLVQIDELLKASTSPRLEVKSRLGFLLTHYKQLHDRRVAFYRKLAQVGGER